MVPSSELSAKIGSTSQFTAALRHCETEYCSNPIIIDHLAQELCGDEALQLALKELQALRASQGDGKHLRVPARTRILEDWLLQSLQSHPFHVKEIQVVSLGSGLDTRPWRLEFPVNLKVHWICIDFPEVMNSKKDLLARAGAQCTPRNSPHFIDNSACSKWPLKVSSWHGLGLDLSSISSSESVEEAAETLENALTQTSFDKSLPTVWILEAVLYYMPLPPAGRAYPTAVLINLLVTS
jgi:O-methyltransferase involved in polyketide biosynthesis